MIHRNIKKAPKLVKEQIYQTLIRPQLEYASAAWSPWLKQDVLELEKVQRRAARFVHNNYWPSASVSQMISTLDWESLEARRQKHVRACCSRLSTILRKFQWTIINSPQLHPPDLFVI